MRRTQSKAFRLIPVLLLTTMLVIAMVMELTILDPPGGPLAMWLPKLTVPVLAIGHAWGLSWLKTALGW